MTAQTVPIATVSGVPNPREENDLLIAQNLQKTFVLHNQGGIELPVLQGVSLRLKRGECIALKGISGSGKSTFMKSLYGNYRLDSGDIWVQQDEEWLNIPTLASYELLRLRQQTIGYVSQFLRVIPRVPALTVAAEPLMELGYAESHALEIVTALFQRLNLPQRLWELSPSTFSGGEKQRVNIARAFSAPYPIFLLDEPTSALDESNRAVVIELIEERKQQGCALIGIFHDEEVCKRVCNRTLTF